MRTALAVVVLVVTTLMGIVEVAIETMLRMLSPSSQQPWPYR